MDKSNEPNDDNKFPQSFFCPLTLQVMKDPVMDHEGNSYERNAIEDWLKKSETSPVTRNPLTLKDLIPNRALSDAISERRQENSSQSTSIENNQNNNSSKVNLKEEEKVEKIPDAARYGVTLNVSASKSWSEEKDEALVMVTIQPPQGASPTPCDVCCVVDVSGSMGTEATMHGNKEAQGLSLLDIVKHAVKTIINVLQPCDRLALIVYSTNARTVFDLTTMDNSGKAKALRELEKLSTEDQTNLWDGLHSGLEIIRKSKAEGRLSSVLILTDGQPNVIPPRGHLPMLQKYKDENPISCSINTFGFGYNLDSELLKDLAIAGNGMYVFIPDSGFVGTAFVNSLSNLLATMAKNVQLSLEPMNGASIVNDGVLGGYPSQYTTWGASVSLGSLQFEQSKNVVVRVKFPKGIAPETPYLTATLKYETKDSVKTLELSKEGSSWDSPREVEVQRHRLVTVDTLRKAVQLMKKGEVKLAQDSIKLLVQDIKTSETGLSDARVKALVQDLEGQTTEALSKTEFFTKWGVHYLPSLINAHLLQVCNNFKDPGVQIYGGKIFQNARDNADAIFVKLPPPKPTISQYSGYSSPSKGGSTQKSAPAPVKSMKVYHSSGNPCFHGNCMIQMADGTSKKVNNISVGDKLMTPSRKPVDVLCVVKTHCNANMAELVQLPGGLLLTPYHPVRINGKWEFPCDLAETRNTHCDAVYSFILREEHVVIIDGIQCVTLGHNFQEEVVKHPYFGSQLVIQDLQKMRGWNSGLVQLMPGCLIRDNVTGLICGFRQTTETQCQKRDTSSISTLATVENV